MGILRTIGLKKYYGSEPNITRAMDGRITADSVLRTGAELESGGDRV